MRRSVVTLGETMVRLTLPEHGRPGSQTPLSLGIGGAESNVAMTMARLGVPSTWIGRVGDDDFGSLVIREIRGEGVRVIAHRDPDAPTGLLVKEHRSGRPSTVRYYRSGSAGSRLSPDQLDPAAVAEAGLLHLTGITPALGPGPAATVQRAVEVARAAGTVVSFDLNYRSSLWSAERAGPALAAIVPTVDVVFAGLEEASLLLTGRAVAPDGDPPAVGRELAAGIAALGPDHVVVKLGDRGALALRDSVVSAVEAFPVQVVDTVGAGDAFVGGYLAAFLTDADPATCLATGARLGALVCGVRGDWEGLLDWVGLDAEPPGQDVRR